MWAVRSCGAAVGRDKRGRDVSPAAGSEEEEAEDVQPDKAVAPLRLELPTGLQMNLVQNPRAVWRACWAWSRQGRDEEQVGKRALLVLLLEGG